MDCYPGPLLAPPMVLAMQLVPPGPQNSFCSISCPARMVQYPILTPDCCGLPDSCGPPGCSGPPDCGCRSQTSRILCRKVKYFSWFSTWATAWPGSWPPSRCAVGCSRAVGQLCSWPVLCLESETPAGIREERFLRQELFCWGRTRRRRGYRTMIVT